MNKFILTILLTTLSLTSNSFAKSNVNEDLPFTPGPYTLAKSQNHLCGETFGSSPTIHLKDNALYVGSLIIAVDLSGNEIKDPAEAPYLNYPAEHCGYLTIATTQPGSAHIVESFACDSKIMNASVTDFVVVSETKVSISLKRNNNPTISCDYLLKSALK